jgi:heat shock protein HtpX
MLLNRTKTMILMATLTALFLWAGQALAGQSGLVMALVLAAAMNLGTYWFSDRIVLAMTGAREVHPAESPVLYQIVHGLAARANMPGPIVSHDRRDRREIQSLRS